MEGKTIRNAWKCSESFRALSPVSPPLQTRHKSANSDALGLLTFSQIEGVVLALVTFETSHMTFANALASGRVAVTSIFCSVFLTLTGFTRTQRNQTEKPGLALLALPTFDA